jgi:hypothetical protein
VVPNGVDGVVPDGLQCGAASATEHPTGSLPSDALRTAISVVAAIRQTRQGRCCRCGLDIAAGDVVDVTRGEE